ncbi:MDR family MFS transporter [Streptomyces sp. 7-21]|uniref:MDR family MFS transporter n=1 Tax=Streptomyces sp. 7-21 TaxID=2802283 RepID=UPI00191FAABC|nr:MDR family MFS transporter [Streptomyces sp. 7-21]MBL1068916.1 MFS transporter [Streptomyces sp. 7-21]
MAQHVAAQEEAPGGQRSLRLVLSALCIAIMLAMLDNMIIGTAMPTIVGELGGVSHLSWVVTAYTLTTAVSTPVWGKLGDMYGRKGVFLASIAVFVAGSALCGLAQDMGQLIAFRAVQGLGAGGLMVGVMALVGDLVPPRERGRYQGMIAATMAIAMIGGPSVGGVITDHLGWRWTFSINVPLGILALAMVATLLRLPGKRPAGARIDVLGAALLATGITAVVLVTTWGGTEYDWDSGVILGLAATGLAALAAFVWAETRAAEPVMPLHLFRSRNFALMTGLGFSVGFMMFGAVLYLPVFQQAVQNASATNSGLLLLPMLLAMMVTSALAGRLTTQTGRYKALPIAGCGLLVAGMLLLAQMDTGTSRLTTGVFMALVGAGVGLLMQTTMLVAQNSVEARDMGVASSTNTLFRTVGQSFGVALMGAVFTARVEDETGALGGGTAEPAPAESAQLTADALAGLPDAAREAYQSAVAAGTSGAFWLAAAVAAAGFVLALFVREVPLRGGTGGSAGGAGGAGDRSAGAGRAGRAAVASPAPAGRSGPPRRPAG